MKTSRKEAAVAVLVELTQDECLDLLRGETVARVALCTPEGPRIVPVNFTLVDGFVVIRTAPYSLLGTYGRDAILALETDRLDTTTHAGWSVVVRGVAEMVEDVRELQEIRATAEPEPWATGHRNLYLRIRVREVTGRRVAGPTA
jgi:nitroimidazol reductase NimA-like FMN-containing flavoprotein (pyridoxamine 5'-phosphate oxidase superfamily)